MAVTLVMNGNIKLPPLNAFLSQFTVHAFTSCHDHYSTAR